MTNKKPHAAETHTEEPAMAIPADSEQSVYRFIVVAAKRARQLQTGGRAKISASGHKSTRVAVEEVRRGLIHYEEVVTPPVPPEKGPSEQ